MTTPPQRTSPLTLAALVVSVLSLLVGVGATSYAAGLARNSVGTAQLRNGAVTTGKLRPDAVTGAKVCNGSIGRSDLAPGLVAPPPVHAQRVLPVDPSESVRLASVNGLQFDASCSTQGAAGAIAVLDVRAASPDAPALPLTATYLVARRDAGSSAPDVSVSGASAPFTAIQLLTAASSSGTGQATLSGLVQYLDQAPVRVDLGVSATAGPDRLCRVSLLATPAR